MEHDPCEFEDGDGDEPGGFMTVTCYRHGPGCVMVNGLWACPTCRKEATDGNAQEG